MRKKTLVILTILYFALAVIGVVVIVGGSSLLASSYAGCYDTPHGISCDSAHSSSTVGGIALALGILAVLAGSILGIVAWIGGLVKQAQQQQWAWFICTLIFGIFCLVIYLIAVPEQPRYVLQGYLPVYPPMQPYQPYPPQQLYQQQQYPERTDDPWRPS